MGAGVGERIRRVCPQCKGVGHVEITPEQARRLDLMVDLERRFEVRPNWRALGSTVAHIWEPNLNETGTWTRRCDRMRHGARSYVVDHLDRFGTKGRRRCKRCLEHVAE
jgi:hypothetical protein